jgi:hypothetical protein
LKKQTFIKNRPGRKKIKWNNQLKIDAEKEEDLIKNKLILINETLIVVA